VVAYVHRRCRETVKRYEGGRKSRGFQIKSKMLFDRNKQLREKT
jgi:hypothetical protein